LKGILNRASPVTSEDSQMNRNESELDELQRLLRRQVALSRQGKDGDVEALCERTSSAIKNMAEAGVFESVEFENRRKELERLYGSLCLSLNTQMSETVKELKRIRRGRKVIGTYRKNI